MTCVADWNGWGLDRDRQALTADAGGKPAGDQHVERQSVRVTILPDRKDVWVVTGCTVRDALNAAAVPLSMPCGGRGRCGRCVVSVRGAVSKVAKQEREKLPKGSRVARLACVARIEGNATITVPEASRATVQKIVARGKTSGSYDFRPPVIKVFLGKRERRAMRALERRYGVGFDDIALGMTDAGLADACLAGDRSWRLGVNTNATVVATAGEIVGFEAGDTSSECYGVAVDVGTNTVVTSLVDLATGRELAVASAVNPQVMHGDDVISRIRFSKTPGGLEVLRLEVVNLINGLVDEMARSLRIDRRHIYACSAVGNTAMQHVLVGISPADLGTAPYRVRLVSAVETLASRAGLIGHPNCRLYLPPVVGGFVGGDLVALIVSQSLHKRKRATLAVDLGTNGELVLAAAGRIVACSTAAGPAFEGERIGAGVRAIEGAIEDVRITARGVKVTTIGGARPVGLCGSGLLAAVAEMLRVGVVDGGGRIRTREEVSNPAMAKRIGDGERGREFTLSDKPAINLRQGDIRELQLGKAAISAGIRVLLRAAEVEPAAISEVLVAGSFGSALKPSTIRAIGFVPGELRGRVRIIGNSAIEGAKIFLTSEDARAEAGEIASRAEHVELFSRPEFNDQFYAAMRFSEA